MSMTPDEVHQTVNRLVEAERDLREAQTRRNEFVQTRILPRPPSRFEGLPEFLDFHEQRRRFEDDRRSLDAVVEKAEYAYKKAEGTLMKILPEDVPLIYDYEGKRKELIGVRFTITNSRITKRLVIHASSAFP